MEPFESHEQAAGYLAGMIDGEGTIALVEGERRVWRKVRISNTDRALLDACASACDLLGIACSILGPYQPARPEWSPSWVLQICGRRNFRLIEQLPLRAPAKRERLRQMLTSYRYGGDGIYNREVPPEALRLRGEGLTQQEIATRLGCSQKTVSNWLRRAA